MNARRHPGTLSRWFAGFALVGALPAAASQTFLLDDFGSGNDDAWTRLDQSANYCEDGASYDASSGAYEMESACAFNADADHFIAARWDGLIDPDLGSGHVRMTARHGSGSTEIFVNLRSNGNIVTGLQGYRFRIPTGGTELYIDRHWEHGSVDEIASATDLSLMFEPGRRINIEAGAVGHRLSLKVWQADAGEPAQPQLVVYDSRIADGDVVIGMSHDGRPWSGQLEARFDDIYFFTASPDIDGNGAVDAGDLLAVIMSWGSCEGCDADLTNDGQVDFADVRIVLTSWD